MVGCSRTDEPVTSDTDAVIDMGPFVRIGTDNTVTVIVKHLDKGQGITTGLPTIGAEELAPHKEAVESLMRWLPRGPSP